MSDGSNKNPVSSMLDFVKNTFWLVFLAALFFGLATGLKPSQGNVGSVLDWGSLIGAWFNSGVRSTSNTFLKDAKGLETVNGEKDQLPSQPKDFIPASQRTQNGEITAPSSNQVFIYKDLDNDGVITTEEIAKQNQ